MEIKKKKNWQAPKEYKKSRQNAKRVISLAKGKKQKECPSNDHNHQNEIFWIAKQMVNERLDITGSNCLKGVSSRVRVDKKRIKDSWKECMEKLMNEENEWDHRISRWHVKCRWRCWCSCGDPNSNWMVPLLTNKDISLIVRGRLYSNCVCEVVCCMEVRPGS